MPDLVASAAFREALSRWATGVAVVTCEEGGERAGLTVSSFTSVSLDPPLVLFCLDRRAESLALLGRAGGFAVSLLQQDQQATGLKMAQRGADKFASVPTRPGPSGHPLIEGALAHLECRTNQIIEAGDHLILIGEVVAAAGHEGAPLLYFQRQFGGFVAS
jgi:flavin reductase (DIM6/NTAB) family NADH-FMN oxidoreductase RutF